MNDLERRTIAALYWPGWVAVGEPDVSARIAERGAGCEMATIGGPVDEWDWQRYVTVVLIDGLGQRVFENRPTGYIAALNECNPDGWP